MNSARRGGLTPAFRPREIQRRLGLALCAILALGLGSCDSQSPDGSDFVVRFLANDLLLEVSQTQQVAAEITRGGLKAIGEELTFSSSAPGVAEVDAFGTVRAVSAGRATITASAQGQSASIEITVVDGLPTTLVPSRSSVAFDALADSLRVTVEGLNRFGSAVQGPVEWSSANPGVASVTPGGVIRAESPGATQVFARMAGLVVEIGVFVTQIQDDLRIRTRDQQTPVIRTGSSVRLRVDAVDRNGNPIANSNPPVTWSSDDVRIATVDQTGFVQGVSPGSTLIRARIGALAAPALADGSPDEAVFEVEVEASEVTAVQVSPAAATLELAAQLQLDATVFGTGGAVIEDAAVEWSTSNPTVATVTAQGLVVARAYGFATITATRDGRSGVSEITVPDPTVETNDPPAAPILSVSLVTSSGATLTGSPFDDPDGDGHAQSQWQVDLATGNFAAPVVDVVSNSDLTGRVVTGLAASTNHQARVRYRDDQGNWGGWSGIQSFTTGVGAPVPNSPPNTPTLSVGTITTTGATLNGSAFSDPDVGDTHAQTQWQVDEAGGDFSTPVADVTSGTDLTSRALTGLTQGTNYQARVRYQDDGGAWSTYSATAPFTTATPANAPPATPTLSVNGITTTGATLNGSAFSDPDVGDTHAQTQWQIDEAGGDFSTPVVDVTSGTDLTSRVVTGLLASTGYQARVRYQDDGGAFSAYSAPVAFSTTNTAPATPTLTSVTAITTTGATLSGSAFSDPDAGDTHAQTQWQVDEAGGDFSTPVVDVTSGTDLTSRVATGLTQGTNYQARVRYQDDAGTFSAYSASQPFTTATPANNPPATPTLTSVTAITATGATLNGSAFSDPDVGDTHAQSQWQIDEAGGDFSTPVVDATSGTDLTTLAATGLQPHSDYVARVRYQDDNGAFSPYGTAVAFSTTNTLPAAPTVSAGSITKTAVTLTGTAFSDGDAGDTHGQTQWQVDEQGGDWSVPVFEVTNGTDLLSRAVTGLTAGTAYQARARYADNVGGFGAYSATVDFTTVTNSVPDAPTVSVTGIGKTTATLNGTAFVDGDAGDTHGQTQWQIDEQGGDWSVPVFDATAAINLTSRAVTGLLAGTAYQARARYQDSDGAFGPYSATVDFSTTANTAPSAPTVTVNGIGNTTATLNGTAFSDSDVGDTHAQTQWQIDLQGGDWSMPIFNSTAATNLTSRSVTGLTAGTAYQARARYQDNDGAFGAYGATVNFTTTGGAATTLFSSNWSTATGTSDNALLDGGAWDTKFCSSITVANIIGGASVGWTATPNVMEITRRDGTNCLQVERTPNGLAAGQSYYIRMYIRNDANDPDGLNASNHPTAINTVGDIQFVPWSNSTFGLLDGQYSPLMSVDATTTGLIEDRRWQPLTLLTNGTWYRFEWHIEFVQSRSAGDAVCGTAQASLGLPSTPCAEVRVWPRVYDMAGTLLYDADDYRRQPGWGGSATQSLQEWYDAGNRLVFTNTDLSRAFGVGYEGPGGASDTGENWYYAAVAIGIGDWLGGL